MSVRERLDAVRERVHAACKKRGDGSPVALIGVTKKHPTDKIKAAVEAGLGDVGENYAQELRDKRKELHGLEVRWHFIGPVQTNKVKYVLGTACIHTVDRRELLHALEQRAARDDVTQEVLVQVNVAHEAQKHGADPDALADLLAAFADLERIRCVGLMVIPPLSDPERTRPHFRRLRQLRDELDRTTRPGVELRELSMGMSSDFEVAIEEGATMVRVGTSIFGPRP